MAEPEGYRLLHRPVEAYYRQRMSFDREVDKESPYASFHRYEDRAWQDDSLEWLHHAARLGNDDFTPAKHAMIRLFMEAFWWWDAEVPSTYCDRLLASYRILPNRPGLEWISWLEEFCEGYVAGFRNQVPGRDAERWATAEMALIRLFSHLGLRRGEVPEDDEDLQRVYVIGCCLLADAISCLGGGPGDSEARERAAAWYRATFDACTGEDERWIGNWARWMEARLWLPGSPERARELIEDADDQTLAERVREDEDGELLALLTLTCGDIAWAEGLLTLTCGDIARAEGELSLAFDIYARAALHGFVFQVRQEFCRQAPSAYTLSIYRTIGEHLRARLAEAAELGRSALASRAEQRLHAYFAPHWRRAGREPAAGAGFPEEPGEDDLGSVDTPFADDVLWLIIHMDNELAAPLDAPLFPEQTASIDA